MVDLIRSIFLEHASSSKKTKMENYMKNLFPFFGVPSPIRRMAFKELVKEAKALQTVEVLDLAKSLWKEPERECQYLALDILTKHKKRLSSGNLTDGIDFVRTKSWWDTVDALAVHYIYPILSKLEESEEESFVHQLITSSDLWMNRTAIIYQLPRKATTNTKILESAIIPHLSSNQFFHQKAIGWALRQYSKSNPEYVEQFLITYDLSKLSRREASKYL